MKHNILYIGFLGAAMMLTSCSEDFLEVKSHTQEYADEYYKDADHISQSLVAAYSPLEWNDWNGVQYCPQNIMSDIMADDIWPGGASRTDNQFWHLMANYEAIPTNTMTGLWSNMYSGVKRCNDLLQYAETSRDNLTDEQYNSWTAQARVLRAYYYNLLWKFYGNIPYYTVNPTGDYHAPQLTADSVYANVITDLEGAINLNALPMYWDEDNLGRVSQAMAYMLYAEMVMYQNDQTRYSKALSYMKAIINDSHYGLVDDYASIWTSDGEWSKESIFEVNYTDDKSFRGWGTGDASMAGGTVLPRVISVPGGIADLGVDDGWGFAPVRTSAYQMYVSNDTRRDASILDVRAYNAANPDFKARYENTGFWIAKYAAYSKNVARATGDKQLNYNNNLRVYRYAETLLNAAELLVRTGGSTTEASRYLNEVHHRAGLINDVEPTLDNILNERHLEFLGEGKRYWDLIRTGKAATVLVPAGETDANGNETQYRTNTWSEARKYIPIPYTEIAADPSLKQNSNY